MNFGTIPNQLIDDLLPNALRKSYLSITLSTYVKDRGVYELAFLTRNLDDGTPWALTVRWDSSQTMATQLAYLLYCLGCELNGLYSAQEQRKILDTWLMSAYYSKQVQTSPAASHASHSF